MAGASSAPHGASAANSNPTQPSRSPSRPLAQTERESSRCLDLTRADRTLLAMLILAGTLSLGTLYLLPVGAAGKRVDLDELPPRHVEFTLDANSAPVSEWRLLEGIGHTLADRIVDYRRENGPFRSPDDLRKVKGIGPRTLEKIAPLVRFDDPQCRCDGESPEAR